MTSFVVACVLAFSSPGTSPKAAFQHKGRPAKSLTAKEVFSRYRGSIVRITTTFHEGPQSMQGSASGFFLCRRDVVATALHVVEKAESLVVKDCDGNRLTVSSVGRDEASDVALLYLAKPSTRLPLETKHFADVAVGETTFTIGNSLGVLPDSISQGIVSGKRKIAGVPYVQTTAAISQGNSGGPLLDDRGEVVGIVSFYLAKGQSINMASSVNNAMNLWSDRPKWLTLSALLSGNRALVQAPTEAKEVGATDLPLVGDRTRTGS